MTAGSWQFLFIPECTTAVKCGWHALKTTDVDDGDAAAETDFNEQQWRNRWNGSQCISEDRVYRAKEILQNLVVHGARQETHLLNSPLSIAYSYI